MKIATVNVIEYADDSVIGVTSFANDEAGNKEAEDFFTAVIKENGAEDATDDEIDSYLKDSYFEQGSYQCFLVIST